MNNYVFVQSVLDSLAEEIAVLDEMGNIVQVNKSWENFSDENDGGMSCGKPMGINYLDVCRNSYTKRDDFIAKDVLEGLEKIYSGQIENFTLEYPCHSLEIKRWFLLRASKMHDAKGVVLSHSNITDRVLAERKVSKLNKDLEKKIIEKTEKITSINISLQEQMAELLRKDKILVEKEKEVYQALAKEKELNDLKTKFITTISHEIRTPLTNINLSAEILLKYSKTLDEIAKEKYLREIPVASKRITQILEQFFLINKIDSGKIELNVSNVEIKNLCKEALSELNQFYLEADKRIEIKGLEEIATDIKIDSFLVKQILVILLSNSINYSDNNSKIFLDINLLSNSILFTVRDSGIGIPDEDKLKVFNSFYRGTNVSNKPGIGLGLFIAKRSVDICHGNIEFTSCENSGTEFKLSIPITSKEEGK